LQKLNFNGYPFFLAVLIIAAYFEGRRGEREKGRRGDGCTGF
jgi:hypothetical protein